MIQLLSLHLKGTLFHLNNFLVCTFHSAFSFFENDFFCWKKHAIAGMYNNTVSWLKYSLSQSQGFRWPPWVTQFPVSVLQMTFLGETASQCQCFRWLPWVKQNPWVKQPPSVRASDDLPGWNSFPVSGLQMASLGETESLGETKIWIPGWFKLLWKSHSYLCNVSLPTHAEIGKIHAYLQCMVVR